MFSSPRTRYVKLAARLAAVAVAALALLGRSLAGQAPAGGGHPDGTAPTYEEHIRPILARHCFECHDGVSHKAGLDMTSAVGVRAGSESGEVVVAGDVDGSLLYQMLADELMPPEGNNPVSPADVDTIRRWIEAGAPWGEPVGPEVTEQDVLPLLYLRCTVCHGLRRQEGELDLRTRQAMLAGGKSGPAMLPGQPEESLMLRRIHAGEMPPPRRVVEVSVKPMEPSEVALLTRWIAAGAPESDQGDPSAADAGRLASAEDRQFWAFQSPRPGPIPSVSDAARLRNPIDAFVVARLEERGLSLSPEADRRTLIRRACYDLLGLPPSPKEVERFVGDASPDAYERLIERLLASSHYGERWGRHWLDLAGYADSEGVQNSDPVRPHAWRYRDYVIRSLNADKPYDRFLLEQLAGDELADYEQAAVITQELYDNLVATGFLRMAPDGTFAAITGFVPDRLDVIHAEMEVLTSAVMGLTLRCARCHSHKFDPFPQQDYYRLLAIFKGAFDEHDWLKPNAGGAGSLGHFEVRNLPYVTSGERKAWEEQEARLNGEAAALRAHLDELVASASKRHQEERLAMLPATLHDDLRRMLATSPEERDVVQQYLAEKFESGLRITREELAELDAQFKQSAERIERSISEVEAKRRPQPMIRALWDRGQPSPIWLLRRGNYLQPGAPLEPGVPAVLDDTRFAYAVEPPWPDAPKTGRRLAFARWLTRTGTPAAGLTARVMVNRIWGHHFGRGIVATPDNFGRTGAPPTHPELLDWLAIRFMESGWSIKQMHRLIMASSTYRQSSQTTAEHGSLDPDNRLLSRMPLKRLEAEPLRDALLFVAGRLDSTPFGPADGVDERPDGMVIPQGSARGWRRSVYVLQRRTQIPTLLETFDLPRMSPNCIERTQSNVAPQALHLLNNQAIRELADAFAARVVAEAGSDPERQIEVAYRIALARPPTNDEQRLASDALARMTALWATRLGAAGPTADAQTATTSAIPTEAAVHALGNLCHALMNSAEFLYID